MKAMLFAALALVGSTALAHGGHHHHGGRPVTHHLTCAQAYDLVQSHGAIVLQTTHYAYDRYVAHQGFCSNAGDETTRPAWVPTVDEAACFVGYTCEQDNRGNGGN